jgi:hypothetical protein
LPAVKPHRRAPGPVVVGYLVQRGPEVNVDALEDAQVRESAQRDGRARNAQKHARLRHAPNEFRGNVERRRCESCGAAVWRRYIPAGCCRALAALARRERGWRTDRHGAVPFSGIIRHKVP